MTLRISMTRLTPIPENSCAPPLHVAQAETRPSVIILPEHSTRKKTRRRFRVAVEVTVIALCLLSLLHALTFYQDQGAWREMYVLVNSHNDDDMSLIKERLVVAVMSEESVTISRAGGAGGSADDGSSTIDAATSALGIDILLCPECQTAKAEPHFLCADLIQRYMTKMKLDLEAAHGIVAKEYDGACAACNPDTCRAQNAAQEPPPPPPAQQQQQPSKDEQ